MEQFLITKCQSNWIMICHLSIMWFLCNNLLRWFTNWSQERKLRQMWHKTNKRRKSLSLFGEFNTKVNCNAQKTQSLYRMRGTKPTWKKIGKKTWLLWNFSGTPLKKRIIISNMWISHGFQPLCQGTKDLAYGL